MQLAPVLSLDLSSAKNWRLAVSIFLSHIQRGIYKAVFLATPFHITALSCFYNLSTWQTYSSFKGIRSKCLVKRFWLKICVKQGEKHFPNGHSCSFDNVSCDLPLVDMISVDGNFGDPWKRDLLMILMSYFLLYELFWKTYFLPKLIFKDNRSLEKHGRFQSRSSTCLHSFCLFFASMEIRLFSFL